ncbi:CopD family protein [Bradyrhizobium brasilense]|uniref:CopD family protein n=1 Tax=Bradyrhizobium brasilense TaxID=1419277 RepID=UPI001E607ACE|nr:CopD family protein [Bradyrhizobium brasilense]MCC8973203.1 CopD family protein [Bradyrhizobium brasilense]
METVLSLARGTAFASTAAFGGFCWGLALWREGLESGTRSRFTTIASIAASAGLVLGLLYLTVRIGAVLGKPVLAVSSSDVLFIILGTRFGRAQVAALGFVLVGVASLRLLHKPGLAASFSALSLLVGLSSSHSAAGGTIADLAINMIHVAAAALWFGGLSTLVVAMARQAAERPESKSRLLSGFSTVALPLMLLVVATGVALAIENVGTWPGLVATEYGWLLTGKLACIGPVLICAAFIRQRLLPLLKTGGATQPLAMVLKIELAFAFLVTLLAGCLSQAIPSRHVEIVWPLSFRLDPAVAWATVPGSNVLAIGGCIALLIGSIAAFELGRMGRWRWATIAAVAGPGVAGAVALPGLSVPAYPSTYSKVPVPYDAEAIARGQDVFAAHCVACHGLRGRGDGPLAKDLKPPPADLTAPHTRDHTMGDMYWWVSHGFPSSAMPGFAESLSDLDRWRVVEYVMALSLGHEARVLGPEISAGQPWLHAIDFPTCRGVGPRETLKDRSDGRSKLVLVFRDGIRTQRLDQLTQHARAIEQAGGMIVAVMPFHSEEFPSPGESGNPCIVFDMDHRIAAAWNLYRRTMANPGFDDNDSPPAIIEFLIDRFGFVRARWRSDETEGLASPSQLVDAITQLQAEPEINKRGVHDH